jgi:multidrug resistance efflux pump
MNTGSVGALHVALVAAFVGWIVFSLSHSALVWKKRNAGDTSSRSIGWLLVAMLLCSAALAGGWLNRELQRRAGIISGTDFFVVRARAGATPNLAKNDSITQGATLATFDSPEAIREEERLRGEITALEEQIHVRQLQPLSLNPELLRRSQETSDLQRARLTELGFGVLGQAAIADPVAAERAKSKAADLDLWRTRELVKEGIVPRQKLDGAVAAAQAASQSLLEREQLVSTAKSGAASEAHMESEIRDDGARARAARSAEISELEAELTERHNDVFQLLAEQTVKAPFRGNIVYRNPSPALASSGQVILAVASGAGFVATVQVPARDTSMLVPGQQLALKLEHSLVSEEISGRLASVQPTAGSDDRSTLLIDCSLPPEQFAAVASESVPVTLQWRPPLYTDRVTQFGLLLGALVVGIWVVLQVRNALRVSKAEGFAVAEPGMSTALLHISETEPLRQGRSGGFGGYASSIREGWSVSRREDIGELIAPMDQAAEMAGSTR